MSEQNLYFVVMARSRNEADAIAEAKQIAEQFGSGMGVTVKRCGIGSQVAMVLRDGSVVFKKTEANP